MAKASVKTTVKKKNIFKRIGSYFGAVYGELKKVTWPTRAELLNHTWVTIIMVAIFAVVIYGFDTLFAFLTNLLYKIV